MTRILAYQLYRRNYYLDKFNTNIPSHRPTSEVSKLAPLGDLDYDTGQLIINPNIRRLLPKEGRCLGGLQPPKITSRLKSREIKARGPLAKGPRQY